MIDTTTQHTQFLENTQSALSRLLTDQQKADSAVAHLVALLAEQDAAIATYQARRATLLSAQTDAQVASNTAEAARDLARGTEVEQRCLEEYAAAHAHLQQIRRDLLDLAGADGAANQQKAELVSLLEAAREAQSRVNERVGVATTIVDDATHKHREELHVRAEAQIRAAIDLRNQLRIALKEAEQAIQDEQAAYARVIAEWPEYARQTLLKMPELEVPDQGALALLATKHEYALAVEETARQIPQDHLQYHALGVPVHIFHDGGNREKAFANGTGRPKNADLWFYDSAMEKFAQTLETARASSRQTYIERLISK